MAATPSAWLRWLIVVVYAAAIFIQSGQPAALSGQNWPGADKLLHFAAYALMAVLICRALAAAPMGQRPTVQIALAAVWLASLYGGSDELHQALVPERSAEFLDWIADLAGSLAGAAGWAGIRLRPFQV
jgi:VanZ family protein